MPFNNDWIGSKILIRAARSGSSHTVIIPAKIKLTSRVVGMRDTLNASLYKLYHRSITLLSISTTKHIGNN
jgi:hypothetical protein